MRLIIERGYYRTTASIETLSLGKVSASDFVKAVLDTRGIKPGTLETQNGISHPKVSNAYNGKECSVATFLGIIDALGYEIHIK